MALAFFFFGWNHILQNIGAFFVIVQQYEAQMWDIAVISDLALFNSPKHKWNAKHSPKYLDVWLLILKFDLANHMHDSI